jgi:hypothetical protein
VRILAASVGWSEKGRGDAGSLASSAGGEGEEAEHSSSRGGVTTGARYAEGLTTFGGTWAVVDRGVTSGIPVEGDGDSSGIAAEGGIEGTRGARSAGSAWEESMTPPGASVVSERAGVEDAARID